jgi:thioesterase domain-containing protein/acyl carrier protein
VNGSGASHPATRITGSSASPETIRDCWSKVLEVENVGSSDNFFDLGGDSILAVELLLELESSLGVHADLSVLFEHPTLTEFCRHLQPTTNPTPTLRHLRVCRSEGEGAPLFCFAHLAYPGSSRPVFYDAGYYDRIHSTDESWTLRDIESIVDDLADEVDAVHPSGILHFSGFCHGSWLALAVARRLVGRGRRVGYLGLIESFPRPEWYWPMSAIATLRTRIGDFLRFDAGERANQCRRHVANMRAYREFERKQFDGVLPCPLQLFFRMENLSEREIELVARRWQVATGANLAIHRLPGSHMGVRMQDDPVEFGMRIEAMLQESERALGA